MIDWGNEYMPRVSNRRPIFIVDMENAQESYAACFCFIKMCLNKRTDIDDEQKKLLNILQITFGYVDSASSVYREVMMKKRDSEVTSIDNMRPFSVNDELDDFCNEKIINDLCFHIRVHMDDTYCNDGNNPSIIRFQHLALILRYLEQKGLIKAYQNNLDYTRIFR